MNTGLSAESPNASRNLLIAALRAMIEIYESIRRPEPIANHRRSSPKLGRRGRKGQVNRAKSKLIFV